MLRASSLTLTLFILVSVSPFASASRGQQAPQARSPAVGSLASRPPVGSPPSMPPANQNTRSIASSSPSGVSRGPSTVWAQRAPAPGASPGQTRSPWPSPSGAGGQRSVWNPKPTPWHGNSAAATNDNRFTTTRPSALDRGSLSKKFNAVSGRLPSGQTPGSGTAQGGGHRGGSNGGPGGSDAGSLASKFNTVARADPKPAANGGDQSEASRSSAAEVKKARERRMAVLKSNGDEITRPVGRKYDNTQTPVAAPRPKPTDELGRSALDFEATVTRLESQRRGAKLHEQATKPPTVQAIQNLPSSPSSGPK